MAASVIILAFIVGCLLGMTSGQIHRCTTTVCQNGGQCYIDASGNEACFCMGAFKGPLCQYTDLCINNPCQNSAPCIPTSNWSGYTCSCLTGYTGKNCQTLANMCASNPCVRGNCQNNMTDFVCRCPAGYIGKTCDNNVGLCYTNPCNRNDSGAVCSDDAPGYSCECSSDDYFGLNCEGTTKGCVEEEQSYCVCAVNNLPVKFPFPKPEVYHGVRTRDVIDALIGLIVGYAVGSLALWLYHFCCAKPIVVGAPMVARPTTSTSINTTSTGLSGKAQPMDIDSKPGSPKNANVYRAGFTDEGLSHTVASRKSQSTYMSGEKDW